MIGKLLVRKFTPFFMESSYVSRLYGDSLRHEFVGYVPIDAAKFEALRTMFETEISKPWPDFASLLGIEAALVEQLPDDLIMSRFWAVEDRFNRVVPLAARECHEKSVQKRGDPIWTEPAFVRNQTRALLDAIQSNYLVNIAREKSVGRLKFILGIAFVVTAVVASAVASQDANLQGYVLLAVAGIFGAVLSIANRLQAAVSRDAMTEDGLAEVYGLRTGWAGVLVSMFLGGGFALVLYGVVMAGLLGFAWPSPDRANPSGQMASSASAPPVSVQAPLAGATSGAAPLLLVADTAAGPPAGVATITPQLGDCPEDASASCRITHHIASSLGLQSTADLFKMLILAFLAGFAERLAPDILGRLSKGANRT